MVASDKTSSRRNQTALLPALRGYIEGYYGRLLDWDGRARLLHRLASLGLNAYFYAPKEDVNHRLCWKKKYSKEWRLNFRKFT